MNYNQKGVKSLQYWYSKIFRTCRKWTRKWGHSIWLISL